MNGFDFSIHGLQHILDPILKRIRALETQESPPGGLPSIISGRLNVAQNIANGGWVTINFVEVVDTDDQYTAPQVTISVPGIYKISAQIVFQGSADSGANQEERGIRLNGTFPGLSLVGATPDALVEQAVALPPITLELAAGDNFVFQARQESSAPLDIGQDAGTCYFTVECLRRT